MQFTCSYNLLVYLIRKGLLHAIYTEHWTNHFAVEVDSKRLLSLFESNGYETLERKITEFCYALKDDYQCHFFNAFYFPDTNEVEFVLHREIDPVYDEGKTFDAYLDITDLNKIFSKCLAVPIRFRNFEE